MHKKDFELIASILKYRIITLDDNTNAKILVNDFANNLADLYPRFNKEKFLKACGVEHECSYGDDSGLCWECNKYNPKQRR